MKDKEMLLEEHIKELRIKIIWVIFVFIFTLVIGFFTATPLIEHLKNDPAAQDIPWNVFGLTDALSVYLQFAFIISMVFTFPFCLFQLWKYVSPGLSREERKVTLSFIPAAAGLFVIGLLFAYYFVFPYLVDFMSMMSEKLGTQESYGIRQYFRFLINIVFPIGLLFELPVVILFFTYLGVLKPAHLTKFRKVAYLILVLIAGMVTPPEIISNILVSLPLIALYECSVWLSRIVYKKKSGN
ncbi:twin-arginine translocase subunit TatC [Virgibacillus necropolis]|uniref:twin-arginine translocase subunit TatC n=1 Tax=Virgibacillus necropolis TaxID=163877 RepID=UPI00384C81BC